MTVADEELPDDANHDLLPTVTAILRLQAYVGLMAASGPDMAMTMARWVRHLSDSVAWAIRDRLTGGLS